MSSPVPQVPAAKTRLELEMQRQKAPDGRLDAELSARMRQAAEGELETVRSALEELRLQGEERAKRLAEAEDDRRSREQTCERLRRDLEETARQVDSLTKELTARKTSAEETASLMRSLLDRERAEQREHAARREMAMQAESEARMQVVTLQTQHVEQRQKIAMAHATFEGERLRLQMAVEEKELGILAVQVEVHQLKHSLCERDEAMKTRDGEVATLGTEIGRKNERIRDLEVEMADKAKEAAEGQQKAGGLAAVLKDGHAEFEDLKKKLSSSEAESKARNEEVSRLKTAMTKLEESRKGQEAEVKSLRDQLSEKSEATTRASKELDDKEKEAEQLREESKAAARRIEEKADKIQRLTRRLASSNFQRELEAEDKDSDIRELKSTLSERETAAQDAAESHSEEMKRMEEQYQEEERKCSELRRTVEDKEQQLELLEGDRARARDEADDTAARLAICMSAERRLTEENAFKEGAIADLKKSVEDKDLAVEQGRKRLEEQGLDISRKTERVAELESAREELEASVLQLKDSVVFTEMQLQARASDVVDKKDAIAKMEANIAAQESRIQELEKTTHVNAVTMKRLEDTHAADERALEETRNNLETKQQSLEELERQVGQLQRDLAHKETSAQAADVALERETADREAMVAEVSQKASEIATLREAATERDGRIQELQRVSGKQADEIKSINSVVEQAVMAFDFDADLADLLWEWVAPRGGGTSDWQMDEPWFDNPADSDVSGLGALFRSLALVGDWKSAEALVSLTHVENAMRTVPTLPRAVAVDCVDKLSEAMAREWDVSFLPWAFTAWRILDVLEQSFDADVGAAQDRIRPLVQPAQPFADGVDVWDRCEADERAVTDDGRWAIVRGDWDDFLVIDCERRTFRWVDQSRLWKSLNVVLVRSHVEGEDITLKYDINDIPRFTWMCNHGPSNIFID